MVALPALLVLRKCSGGGVGDGGAAGHAAVVELERAQPPLLVMVALPAVLAVAEFDVPLLVMVALPAVLVSKN